MARMVSEASFCRFSMTFWISLAASSDCVAKRLDLQMQLRQNLSTASPALAASMDAFRARRLVWLVMFVMSSVALLILVDGQIGYIQLFGDPFDSISGSVIDSFNSFMV